MPVRDPNLQLLLDHSRDVISRCGQPLAVAAGARVFSRLAESTGPRGPAAAERLPACGHNIDAALASLAAMASPLPDLASAFAAVEADLAWYRRTNTEALGPAFRDGHANAMLIGPRGIEQRDDVWVGVTVMSPGLVYPDHDHPPEEVYIALSAGAWWNSDMDWTEPGPGGVIYNRRGILHAMRSGTDPFLALWFLPID